MIDRSAFAFFDADEVVDDHQDLEEGVEAILVGITFVPISRILDCLRRAAVSFGEGEVAIPVTCWQAPTNWIRSMPPDGSSSGSGKFRM